MDWTALYPDKIFSMSDIDDWAGLKLKRRRCRIEFCARHISDIVVKDGVITRGFEEHSPLIYSSDHGGRPGEKSFMGAKVLDQSD
jgi:hypothetical protein